MYLGFFWLKSSVNGNHFEGLPNTLWTRECRAQWYRLPATRHYFHDAIWCNSGSNDSRFVPKRTSRSSYTFFRCWSLRLYPQVAVLFNPFIDIVLGTLCGVTIPFPTMNTFWRSWLYQLNPYTRTLAAMISTELQWVSYRLSAICPAINLLVVLLSNANRTNSPFSTLLRIKPAQLGARTL